MPPINKVLHKNDYDAMLWWDTLHYSLSSPSLFYTFKTNPISIINTHQYILVETIRLVRLGI